jgi:hypothetical protein
MRKRGTQQSSRRRSATRAVSGKTKTRRYPAGITRVEQASTRTFGFVVRVGNRPSPRGWRPRFKAYFGDFTYGGKKNALAAAEKWLKQLLKSGKQPKQKPAPPKKR